MHLQVLYLRMVTADVTAEGVIDSSNCPIDLRQILFYLVQRSCCFPMKRHQKTSIHLSDHMVFVPSSHCIPCSDTQPSTLLECLDCEATRRLGWPLKSSLICSNQWSCSKTTVCCRGAPGSSRIGGSEPGWSWTPPLDPVEKELKVRLSVSLKFASQCACLIVFCRPIANAIADRRGNGKYLRILKGHSDIKWLDLRLQCSYLHMPLLILPVNYQALMPSDVTPGGITLHVWLCWRYAAVSVIQRWWSTSLTSQIGS